MSAFSIALFKDLLLDGDVKVTIKARLNSSQSGHSDLGDDPRL